jgi:hypothetical protein
MTTAEYYRVFGDALIDYGKACMRPSLRERDEAFRFLFDIIRDREEHHEREADLLADGAKRTGYDISAAFEGSE